MFDGIVIGGGPAGISAALTLRRRNRQVAVISGAAEDNPLWKAQGVDNYPGLPAISGAALLRAMENQARDAGVTWISGRASSVLAMEPGFGVAVGQEFYETRCVILCTGLNRAGAFPGERELLGRGVSYCVTCDGMLYRGKRVALLGFTAETESEAQLLRDMGCAVEVFTRPGRYEILGEERVRALRAGGEEHPCDAVFILRAASDPDTLLPGLAMAAPHVAADRELRTSVPGAFAAGDCAGAPYQIAKAVGEGNVAALTADAWLREQFPADQ